MGRTYVVEETVGQYFADVSLGGKAAVSGLLIGQPSSQKDYVILAARTPPRQDPPQHVYLPTTLDAVDEEWVAAHACQVSRMLPGGLLVLGVFVITTLEMGSEFPSALRRLLFAVGKSMTEKRLWSFTEDESSERVMLHISSPTKKISCRTYDILDPKSSARPADWKYQSRLSASWLSLECTLDVNLHIPLSATSVAHPLERNIKNGLARWAKQIENSIYLINGQVKDEDSDLVEGQKKSRGNTQATSHAFDVRVLRQLLLNSDHRSTATVQICSGSINLKGAVKCRAYIHGNRPKVKDAVQAVKRDILNTVADRCDILFEELILNESPDKKILSLANLGIGVLGLELLVLTPAQRLHLDRASSAWAHATCLNSLGPEKEIHILPHRVFVPIPGSTVMLCDYKFGDDSAEEIRDHFLDMLDHSIQMGELEIAEETNTACVVSSTMNPEVSSDNINSEQPKQPINTTIVLKIQQNIGVIAALAVAFLAAGISFIYFSD